MIRRIGLIVVSATLLAGCGLVGVPQVSARLAQVKPFGAYDSWLPGLVGVDGYAGQGLGPVGYPNVTSTNELDPTQQFLAKLSLQNGDLSSGLTVAVIPQGDSLAGATLDFCGGEYPSEAMRLARRQVAAYDSQGNYAGISTEAVQYETADAAQQALAELVARKKQCPDGTTFTDADGIQHKVTFFPAPAPDGTKVMDDHVVLHEVDVTAAGSRRTLMVWQVRGNSLQAVYASASGSKPFDQPTLDSIFGLVTSLTERLQAADGVELGEL